MALVQLTLGPKPQANERVKKKVNRVFQVTCQQGGDMDTRCARTKCQTIDGSALSLSRLACCIFPVLLRKRSRTKLRLFCSLLVGFYQSPCNCNLLVGTGSSSYMLLVAAINSLVHCWIMTLAWATSCTNIRFLTLTIGLVFLSFFLFCFCLSLHSQKLLHRVLGQDNVLTTFHDKRI